MQKSRIEWTDYTINPVKGLCPVACDYCYARAMYKRFKWNPEIRQENWGVYAHQIACLDRPSRIFVGSTMELFGEWVKPEWLKSAFDFARQYKSHTFIFLTKRPENLIKWSPFPENCWAGVSVDGTPDNPLHRALYNGLNRVEAKVKFLSFEPLLADTRIDTRDLTGEMLGDSKRSIDWTIIGAQTPHSEKTFPKWKWVKEIIEAADKAKIPVFLKNNLGLPKLSCEGGIPFYKQDTGTMRLRQEYPKE